MTPPLMLFAAGFGRRMGPLTADRPKPLIPVAGRTLLDHALAVADEAGIERRVANVHYRAGALIPHLKARGVAVSREDPILETGGGLRAALPLLGPGPVLTLNTDAVWRGPNPLRTLTDAWETAPGDTEALLLCVPIERAGGHAPPGDFAVAPDGRLGWGGPAVYVGAQMIRPEALADVPDMVFSMTRVWGAMMERGTARGVLWPGAWCDVGHPGGLAEAEAMLAQAVA